MTAQGAYITTTAKQRAAYRNRAVAEHGATAARYYQVERERRERFVLAAYGAAGALAGVLMVALAL